MQRNGVVVNQLVRFFNFICSLHTHSNIQSVFVYFSFKIDLIFFIFAFDTIGKGSFGEIFLASDDISRPVTIENAKFVVKIEPHRSGPLFVEIHCLIKAGKETEEKALPLGMPTYMASGGHYFGETRYRFLILPRYDFDLHSIIRNHQLETKNILIIADQLIDILEHIHDSGYAHSDIKGENIMIGKCTYKKDKVNGTSSHNNTAAKNHVTGGKDKLTNRKSRISSTRNRVNNSKFNGKSKSYVESDTTSTSNKSDDSDFSEDFERLSDEDDDEDEEEDVEEDEIEHPHLESDESQSNDSDNSSSDFKPFSGKNATKIEFSGSNPMRSCRMDSTKTQIYDDMVRSHYLRRSTKKVNYCEDEVDEEVIFMTRNNDK